MGQRGLLSAVFGKETRSFLHPAPPTVATESTISTVSTVSRYPPKPTISTKSRFHGTPRKARNQRFQRNHDFTVPQRNHESNETNETNEKHETPGKKAFRCFRCVCINRDFVGNVAQARPKGAHTQSERRADGARKKRCAIHLTRGKELFQPDARSDLLHLGPGLRPGRCGRVGSPEGLGRGSRNTLPGPLAQRSASWPSGATAGPAQRKKKPPAGY